MSANYCLADGPLLPPQVAGYRRRDALLALALVAIVLLCAHRPLLVGFARLFRVDNPAPSDAIVLLLGGWLNRPVRAAELYKQGMAPIILLNSSTSDQYPDLSDAALNRRALLRAGVPGDRIVMLPKICTSTRAEASQVREYIQAHGIRRIIVVTTAFHTSRARWIFKRMLQGTDVEVRVAASVDQRFNESNWYTNRGLLDYPEELVKRIYYQLVY